MPAAAGQIQAAWPAGESARGESDGFRLGAPKVARPAGTAGVEGEVAAAWRCSGDKGPGACAGKAYWVLR